MTNWPLRHTLHFCLLFLSTLALGQTLSFTRDTYPDAPFDFAQADLNNDGREDLISVCGKGPGGGNGNFAISLSMGNGVYTPQTCYALPSGVAAQAVVGDFNSDGNLDLVIPTDTNTFYLYLNDGKGKFHLQNTFQASEQVVFMTAADVNHDSNIDLIWTGFNDQKLNVWFGNGMGGFTVGPSSHLDVQGELSVGDFDGDGKADILSRFTTYLTSIQIAYGDGQGHFQVGSIHTDNAAYMPYDVDGDGKMDLIGEPFDFSINGSTYYNILRILYGNADRTLTEQDITLNQCTAPRFVPAVADFNGDGINDVIVTEGSDCQGSTPYSVNVMLGKGNHTFQPEQTFYSTDFATDFHVVRVNLDSKPDLELFGESLDGSSSTKIFFTNTTPGKFPKCAPPNWALGFNLCSPTKTVTTGTSVRFSIGAANQTPGRKVEVWIDGQKMAENLKGFSHYSFLDATLNLAPGTHRVGIFTAGWDNLVQEYQWTGGPGFTFPLTVKSSICPADVGLIVCSPLNDATLNSPVRAWAVGKLNGTDILRMEVWVDGVKRFTTFGSNTLDTKLDVAPGLHRFTYYLIGIDGTKTLATVDATVR